MKRLKVAFLRPGRAVPSVTGRSVRVESKPLRLDGGRMRLVCSCLLVVMVCSVSAVGQDAAEDVEQERAVRAKPQKVLTGDIITLKNGKVLSGGQVLRSSPLFYQVEFVEGVKPLSIPRSQVTSVEYDDIDLLRERRRRALFPDEPDENVIAGKKLSRELMDKLRSVISKQPEDFGRKDLVLHLQELAKRVGVKLEIHESVHALPAMSRMWSLQTTPDTTLMSLLQETLLKQFTDLDIDFEYDVIVVLTKAAAERINGQDAP